jgi:hypothetical protein
LALSQWGQQDEAMDPVELAFLTRAYMRRERWRARVLLSELAGAISGGNGGNRADVVTSARGKRFRRVGAESAMAEGEL